MDDVSTQACGRRTRRAHPHARERQCRDRRQRRAASRPEPGSPRASSLRERVPQGHKVALADIAEGAPVRRYNVVIGYARADAAGRLLGQRAAAGDADAAGARRPADRDRATRRSAPRSKATRSRATATPTARSARATSSASPPRCSASPAWSSTPCGASAPSCCRGIPMSTTSWRSSTSTAAASRSTRPTPRSRSARCATSASTRISAAAHGGRPRLREAAARAAAAGRRRRRLRIWSRCRIRRMSASRP